MSVWRLIFMKSAKYTTQFLLVAALVCSSQPMQGMSYLKAAYNAAINYWYGKPKQQSVIFDMPKAVSQGLSSISGKVPENSAILQDFEMLIQSGDGSRILERFNESNPITGRFEIGNSLLNPCLNNFEALIKFEDGLKLLYKVKMHSLDVNNVFIQPCLNHFQTLVKSDDGLKMLQLIAFFTRDKNCFLNPCIESFSTLIKSRYGLSLLKGIAFDKTEYFIKPYTDNFQMLIKSENGLQLLEALVSSREKLPEYFITSCIENFPILIQSQSGTAVLKMLASSHTQHFIKPCIDNLQIVLNSPHGAELLSELVSDEKHAEYFVKPYADNLQSFIHSPNGPWLFDQLLFYKKYAEHFIKPCTENWAMLIVNGYGRFLKDLISKCPAARLEIAKKIAQYDNKVLPTSLHFATYLPLYIFIKFKDNTELEELLNTVFKKEAEYKDDYYTFVHGQRRELYLPEKIYTLLWQLKKRQSLQDFFFAHVKDLVESPDAKAYDKVQKNFILSFGNSDGRGGADARRKLLFMNYALFANSRNSGSCTADYVLENENSKLGSTINIALSEPFKMFGYQGVYSDALKNKIEVLAQEYKDASKYGNLLFIAVPKNKVHKYVYLAETGGPKIDIEIDGIGRTSDIRIIMDTLLSAPHKIKDTDELEFCLIMMQHKGGLDPKTGIKIMPILSGDPNKLAELQKKEDELLAEITQRVQDFERRENALARAAVLSKHMNGSVVPQIQSKL